MKKDIQSFIANINVSKSFDEILDRYNDSKELTSLECLFNYSTVEWTSPRWLKKDDIVFFMFAKTAIDTIRHQKKLLKIETAYNEDEINIIAKSLDQSECLYDEFGGSIFAIGRATGKVVNDDFNYKYHWASRIYGEITDIHKLEKPIHISEFNTYITVSRQSSITGIFGSEFENLKSVIIKQNPVPDYFLISSASPLPLAKINISNWIEYSNEHRKHFFLEIQFRTFYVNYLLSEVSDNSKYYMECRCKKNGHPDTFVDNVILFNNRFIPIEIKLNIATEKDLKGQCRQYCHLNHLILEKKTGREMNIEKLCPDKVLIIDTNGIYLFSYEMDKIENVYDLNYLRSKNDIDKLKQILKTIFN